MALPPPVPPLASYVGLVVTFVIVTAIGLAARRPELGGLLTTFPGKIPALILALLVAGRPDEALHVARAGPLGLAAVAVFAAAVAIAAPRSPRTAMSAGLGAWALFVLLASTTAPRDLPFALGAFALVWAACLALAARHASPAAPRAAAAPAMTVPDAMRKAALPALLVAVALWVQPAAGPVLAAALTVMPVNTSSALRQYRGDPASVQRAMLASIANLLSSLAFLLGFLALQRLLGSAAAMVALAVIAAWTLAFVTTLGVKAATDVWWRHRARAAA